MNERKCVMRQSPGLQVQIHSKDSPGQLIHAVGVLLNGICYRFHCALTIASL